MLQHESVKDCIFMVYRKTIREQYESPFGLYVEELRCPCIQATSFGGRRLA
jgi:hypothetical protein